MALITKLLRIIKAFEWTAECKTAWEDIKNQHIQAPILINPNQELEFYGHINVSQVAIGATLTENLKGKID